MPGQHSQVLHLDVDQHRVGQRSQCTYDAATERNLAPHEHYLAAAGQDTTTTL
mgnify:CR=1 FL=1